MSMNRDKNDSIEFILAHGLQKPKSSWKKIIEIVRTIGYRNIFWDTAYGFFITIITLAIAFIIFISLPEKFLFTSATTTAPIIFLIILLFVEMSERINGLYELKQTCHFTITQITALRIIAYSLVGFMLTILMVVFSTGNGDEFLLLFSLCLFVLSICATLSLSLIRLFQGKWIFVMFSGAWIALSVIIPFLLGVEKWENLLREIPITIAFILAVLGCLLLIYRLNKIFTEVKNYAVT